MIVVDASIILELLLLTPALDRIEGRLFEAQSWHAPHLLDLEVVHALRRYALAGDLDPARGREALADLTDLPITRYPHDVLLPRVWQLSETLTVYDAAYVALAEALRAPLVTRYARLAAAPKHRASIELL